METTDLPPDPIYGVPLDPDAPDDHEPLPDAMQQLKHVYDAVQTLEAFFYGTPGVLVSGDTPVYYLDRDGSQRTIYPDCYVAIGVNPISIRRRNGYFHNERRAVLRPLFWKLLRRPPIPTTPAQSETCTPGWE